MGLPESIDKIQPMELVQTHKLIKYCNVERLPIRTCYIQQVW